MAHEHEGNMVNEFYAEREETEHFGFTCGGSVRKVTNDFKKRADAEKISEMPRCPCCKSRMMNYERTGKVLSCTWAYCHFRCNTSDIQRLLVAVEFYEMNMLSQGES